jgi:predicted DNA-binding transcriptional regulator AlpA
VYAGRPLIAATRYLTGSQVAARLGLHVKTLNRYLREGRLDGFPKPRRLTDGVRRWVEREVEHWQLTRIEEDYTRASLSVPQTPIAAGCAKPSASRGLAVVASLPR